MKLLFCRACSQAYSERQWILTTDGKEKKNVAVCPVQSVSETLISLLKLTSGLLSDDKSSSPSWLGSQGQLRACSYSQAAVGVLILVTVVKNRPLTYFSWRNQLNVGIKFTSLGSTSTCHHPRALLSFVPLDMQNWMSGETRIELCSLLETVLLV